MSMECGILEYNTASNPPNTTFIPTQSPLFYNNHLISVNNKQTPIIYKLTFNLTTIITNNITIIIII